MNNDKMSAKQVAEILGLTITNLKFYASRLELNGLEVRRNSRNHREYSDQDVKTIRAMQLLNREKSMSLDDAASFVMSSDTDIDAILSPGLPQVSATIDSAISVVKQESDNAERILSEVLSLMAERQGEIIGLRKELEARDKLTISFQSEISTQLSDQSKTIDALRKELAEMKQVKKSFWSKFFQ